MIDRIFMAAGTAAIMVCAPAWAQQSVTVSAINGDAIVVRGGETFRLQAGDVLQEGDQITTSQGGSVSIQTPAGVQNIAGLQTVTVGPAGTLGTITSVAGTAAAGAATAAATFPVLTVAGGLLAAVAVVEATSDDSPGSP